MKKETPKRGRGRPSKTDTTTTAPKMASKKKPAKTQAKKKTNKVVIALSDSATLAAARERINSGKSKRIFTFADDPSEIKANVVGYISTGSVLLDKVLLNGGLPQGRIVEIFGYEGVSKSTLGYNGLLNAQQLGGSALLIDTERTATKDYLENIGLDCSENGLQLIQENTVEQIVKALYEWLEKIHTYPQPVCIFWDSIAGTSTDHAEKNKNKIGVKKVADVAGVLHREMRILNEIFTKYNILFIAANRRYGGAPPVGAGMFTPEEIKTYGGKVFPFWSSVRIEITPVMGEKIKYMWPWDINIKNETLATLDDKKIKPVGMFCNILVHKNKTGKGHAGVKGRYAVQFGRGFDNYWSFHEDLSRDGYIATPSTSAGWFSFTAKNAELHATQMQWKHGHFGLERLMLDMAVDFKNKKDFVFNKMLEIYNSIGFTIEEFPQNSAKHLEV